MRGFAAAKGRRNPLSCPPLPLRNGAREKREGWGWGEGRDCLLPLSKNPNL